MKIGKIAFHTLMTCATGGIWLVVMLVMKLCEKDKK